MSERVRLNRTAKAERVRLKRNSDAQSRQTTGNRKQAHDVTILDQIEMTPTSELQFLPRRLRNHPESLIRSLAQSFKTFGFVFPAAVDHRKFVWAGEARVKAAQRLGIKFIPTVNIEHLSEAHKRAFRLFDNKIAEKAQWNREGLALEFPELETLLLPEGLDLTVTGFAPVEIDQIVLDMEQNSSDPADEFDAGLLSDFAVSEKGDVWTLGDHVLGCGDGRDETLLEDLVGDRKAAMAFIDPPYNVEIKGVVGRGKTKHAEFAMASGEQSFDEYSAFLAASMKAIVAVSHDGAVHFICCDWRHAEELYQASRTIYGMMINLCVWVKSNGGQGSFYRSQHELVGVYRVGKGKHLNNVELGRHGRSRTNVWHYAGVNTFRAGRLDDLRSHPTVKPIAMVCDAIRDCTRRGDTILDTFVGSGTTLLAAERLGRRAVCVEYEPRYVDLTIRRWQEFTGRDALHRATGRRFDDLAAEQQQKQEKAA